MNSRERILAGLIAGIALLGVGYFGWTKVDAMFQTRRQLKENLDKELKEYEITLLKEYRSNKALKELQKRSLPTDDQVAANEYFNWLLATAKNSGMLKVQVKPSGASRFGNDSFTPHRFSVDGSATLDQLTAFLYKFYSSDDLHRITYYNFKPNTESNDIRIGFTVEAISLPNSPKRTTVGDLKSNRLEGRDLEYYVQSIVNRNLYAPANQAPVIESVAEQTVEKGKFLRVNVAEKTSDPDKNELKYALVDGPDGVRIDEKSGELRWLAKLDPGDYKFSVSATDSGFPPKSATTEFMVAVKDPPPPKEEEPEPRRPQFDEAKHAYLSAVVENDGEMQLWVHIRTTGKIIKLVKGDEIKIGTVEGRLNDIQLKWVEIETEKGPFVVQTGQPLSTGEIRSVVSSVRPPNES
jgi:hypothetical protein